MIEQAHRLLEGRLVRLEPLAVERHLGDLYGAAATDGPGADPELWSFLPYGPFADRASFARHLAAQAASRDPAYFAVVDSVTGEAGGVVSFLREDPRHRVIEIGHIWLGGALQRTPQATEALYLLMRQAFDALQVRRLEWKCDAANVRSRRAAERLGFTYEGTFRQHMLVKGRNRDTAWFSLLDREWPGVRAAFEEWLAPENFDADGRQRHALRARDAAA